MRQNLTRLTKAALVQTLRDAPNLNGSNLTNVDLAGVNLARANLSGGRFHGANLSGSCLQGVVARHASFAGARMRGVVLPAAALEGTVFRSADLRVANLRWTDLEDSNLLGADLSGAQLFEAKMTNAVLTNANMEGARLESVDLAGAVLRDARMSDTVLNGATLRKADLYSADLRRCDLRGADLDGANLLGARLDGAVYDEETVFPAGFDAAEHAMCLLGPDAELQRVDLSGFEFRGADLSRANLSRCKLMGADLRGADLSGADLTGARLRGALYDTETTFPSGFDPATTGAYAVVPRTVMQAAKLQWKRLRNAALSGARLEGADLTGADLTNAQLNSADLTGATLYTANLTGAGLHGAILRRANARGCLFQDADLRRADLRGADFSWADFADADLRGAQLVGASLTDARFRGARYDARTTFPAGFNPALARMKDGEIIVTAQAVDARVGADPFPSKRFGNLSIRAWRRRAKALYACATGERGRATLGPLAMCAGSVALFVVIGWAAMGIHEPPDRRGAPSPRPARMPDQQAPSARGVPEFITVLGAAPIAVDFTHIYTPVARATAAVVTLPASDSSVADATPPRRAEPGPQLPAATLTAVQPVQAPASQLVAMAPDASPPRVTSVDVARERPSVVSDMLVASASSDIVAAVDHWRAVWEARDAEAYVNLYHPGSSQARGLGRGRSGGFTKARLSARARNVFDAYDRIQVNIGNLDVRREGHLVVSTFDEDFVAWRSSASESPDYIDRGRKTLVYARDSGAEWRIVSEQWRPVTQ